MNLFRRNRSEDLAARLEKAWTEVEANGLSPRTPQLLLLILTEQRSLVARITWFLGAFSVLSAALLAHIFGAQLPR